MLKKGIRDVVVCPGSRNTPLIHTFASVGMRCYEVTDERSAGFFALGLIDAKERPVAVCCTSGSAVLNLAPAVAEAYYRPLPLLVITADRPEQWIGQMDGQTMPQLVAFGQTVRKVVSLPESDTPSWHTNRLVNEALLAMERTKGPVHINVPLSEPLFDFSATELPNERLMAQCNGLQSATLTDESLSQWKAAKRPMLVVGQMHPGKAKHLREYIEQLAQHCVILAEDLSNISPDGSGCCRNFDSAIAQEAENTHLQPDFIITLGGHIVSKHLKQWLRKNPPLQHWSVSPTGDVADLFQCLTMVWECDEANALNALAQNLPTAVDADFFEEWNTTGKKTPTESTDWEVNALASVLESVPSSWDIHVANSSMVRDIQRLPSTGCNIYCNRGINGIEGSVSAAVGLAAGSGRNTLLLTGDLSFFYDKNGLWNNYAKGGELPGGGRLRLSILLLNNGGGRIFKGIPGMERTPYLVTMVSGKHTTSAEGVAMECGCDYKSISAGENIDGFMTWLFSDRTDGSASVRILEVKD